MPDELVPVESKHRHQQSDPLIKREDDIKSVDVDLVEQAKQQEAKKVKRAVDHYRWSDYLLHRALRNYKPFTTRPDEPYPIGDGIENCGPGRYRDSATGICQADVQTSVNLP